METDGLFLLNKPLLRKFFFLFHSIPAIANEDKKMQSPDLPGCVIYNSTTYTTP